MFSATTFEEYRLRFPADRSVSALSQADVEALREPALARLYGVESTDQRAEALAWVAYERSGHGARSFAASLDEVLGELVASEPSAPPAPPAPPAEPAPAPAAPAPPADVEPPAAPAAGSQEG